MDQKTSGQPDTVSPAKTIHRLMTIQEILSLFPHKAQRLSQEITNAGLHCIGCHAAVWETLEAGMHGHGLPEQAIDELVKRLNDLLHGEETPATERDDVTLTARAAEKFLEFARQDGKEGYGLRFSDKADGCSGFTYELDFTPSAVADDVTFTSHGIDIYVQKSRLSRLKGSVIDYVTGLSSSGFKIENPNVGSACGCGSSHGYRKEKAASHSHHDHDHHDHDHQHGGGGGDGGGGCCSTPSPYQQGKGGGCCKH